MYHVIMAGGVGARFWPMSTKEKPKQFLKIINNDSLIYLTYKRLLKISTPDKIFIVTSIKYKQELKKQIPEFCDENIIYEPSPKNTAPAIYLASRHINNIDPEDWIIINELSETINQKKLFKNKDELESSMLNYLSLFKEKNFSKNYNEQGNLKFVNEKIIIRKNDYYYSNAIARASKTMSQCRNEKNNFKLTGTEG